MPFAACLHVLRNVLVPFPWLGGIFFPIAVDVADAIT